MADETKLYRLLVEPCDPEAMPHAKALYKEIVDALNNTAPLDNTGKIPPKEEVIRDKKVRPT